jgi:omega-amidase
MRVAVAQMDCRPGDLAANAKVAAELITEAGTAGAELVVLPELADTGYVMADIARSARPLDDNVYLDEVMTLAADLGLIVASGVAERVGDQIYNSLVVSDGPGSILTCYRKVHLHALAGEDRVFTPGDHLGQLRLSELTVAPTICFDLRFPAVFRTLTRAGTEVFVLVAAWPFPRLRHWSTLLLARAIENQSYVVAANRVGQDVDTQFCGSSAIVDPYGTVVASMDEVFSGIAVAEVIPDRVETIRTMLPYLPQEREVELHPKLR